MTNKQRADEQKKHYPVIVVGHAISKRILTPKETITRAKCKKLCQKLEKEFGLEINKIKIMMTQFDYASSDEDAEYVSRIGPTKNAYYEPKKDRLMIWEDGYPVYENHAGYICRDEVTLCDCYC